MESSLFKIIDFLDGNKWFVIAETTYNNQNYKYMIRVTDDEEDFIEEFNLIKYVIFDGKEYAETVTNPAESEAVMLKIIPEIKDVLKNKNQILEKVQA